MNKFVRSLLNIGLSALELSDRTATDVRSRVRDRMEDLTDRVEDLTDHTRN